MSLQDKFYKYVSYNTKSSEESTSNPSTPNQTVLLKELEKEAKKLGARTIFKDSIVYAFFDGATDSDALFLMSHVDTSPDASGENVCPIMFTFDKPFVTEGKEYSVEHFKNLESHKGHRIIVSKGNTLLGADDKAGVAITMQFIEEEIKNPNHPTIIACFTPDEEIGQGIHHVDPSIIMADQNYIYAYTIDGGSISYVNYETFNACKANVTFKGLSIHPSIGYKTLINAQEVAIEFKSLLPKKTPFYSKGREPFNLLTSSSGSIEEARQGYILRSFDVKELEKIKDAFRKAQDKINHKYGEGTCTLELHEQYRNMKEMTDKAPKTVELIEKSYKELNIPLGVEPIRGGTDGAQLSFMGIPCPNLGTGGNNFHGIYEYWDYDEGLKMVEILHTMAKNING